MTALEDFGHRVLAERQRLDRDDPERELDSALERVPYIGSVRPIRSYAGARSTVAIATSLEGRATARATRSEVAKALETAPRPTLDYEGDPSFLEELATCYSRVTGRPVEKVTPGQRRLLATCYRVHGDNVEPLLRRFHAESGETNLLLKVRCVRQASHVASNSRTG